MENGEQAFFVPLSAVPIAMNLPELTVIIGRVTDVCCGNIVDSTLRRVLHQAALHLTAGNTPLHTMGTIGTTWVSAVVTHGRRR